SDQRAQLFPKASSSSDQSADRRNSGHVQADLPATPYPGQNRIVRISAGELADGPSLQRALINLIDNSVDAIKESGAVTITTQSCPASGSKPPDVLLTVSDTGMGIPPEVLPKILCLSPRRRRRRVVALGWRSRRRS